jgi:hypothetical protein
MQDFRLPPRRCWCLRSSVMLLGVGFCWLPKFLDSLSVPCSRIIFSWNAWPLNLGPMGSAETSVTNSWPSLRNIPEELRPQLGLLTVEVSIYLIFYCHRFSAPEIIWLIWWNNRTYCKGAHTRKSLASESGWARFPMGQTRPCVECHEPDLADSGLARQGLRWDSARHRLAIGSYVCGRSQARLAHPQGQKHRQCEFCH